MDWADEIAGIIHTDTIIHESVGEFSLSNRIAKQLRKAKAEGMAEALLIASNFEFEMERAWRAGLKSDSHLEGMSDGAGEIVDRIRAASKLHPTE